MNQDAHERLCRIAAELQELLHVSLPTGDILTTAGCLAAEAIDCGAFPEPEHARLRALVRIQRERGDNGLGVLDEAVTCLLPNTPWNQRGDVATVARLAEIVQGEVDRSKPQEDASLTDPLVRLRQVQPLTGMSARTLKRYAQNGKLPQPTVPGVHGKPNLWLWSILRGPLGQLAKRRLPERFPGSGTL